MGGVKNQDFLEEAKDVYGIPGQIYWPWQSDTRHGKKWDTLYERFLPGQSGKRPVWLIVVLAGSKKIADLN